MTSMLVSRSDVGEFRRRYKWMALGAFLAFGAVVVRLFQLQVVDAATYARSPTTTSFVVSSHPRHAE
jgi:penicillin-binding protein 2